MRDQDPGERSHWSRCGAEGRVERALPKRRSGVEFFGRFALLTAMALLPACGANGVTSGTTSTSATSTMTSATAAATTTAIAALPTKPGPRTVKWVDLEVGDCLAAPPPTDLSVVTVTIVDCSTAHAAEVYSRAAVEVNAAIADVADRECVAGVSQYTGRGLAGSPFVMTYLIDSNQDRTSSNPTPSTVICLLQAANGRPLAESARR